jgi:lysophospholipase L1-like esterase
VLKPLENFKPDKIILAMGTNQFRWEDKQKWIDEYFEKLTSIYPDTPTLAITPIWRNYTAEEKNDFEACAAFIRAQAEKYPNITLVDGLTLVPGCLEFYIDGLHPNALGMTLYGQNLANTIKKLGW